MSQAGQSGGRDAAARAARALERGATRLASQVARSVQERWLDKPARQAAPRQAGEPPAARSAAADADVSAVEAHDLRAELARELERLADADIKAARGPGRLAGDAEPAD